MGTDITEQMKFEEALNVSDVRLRTALIGSLVTVFSLDCDLRYTWVYNPSPGFNVETVLGKRDYEIYSPEGASFFMAIKRDMITSGIGRREEVAIYRPISAGGDFIHDITTELHLI